MREPPRKAPAFQFYPGDHLRDAALRSCSIAARGLWLDLLCYMHDGTPYGHLAVGKDTSKGIPEGQLAQMVGVPRARLHALLRELERAGVFSRTATGVIYSRRMVRDEHVRQARAAGGRRSLEHPNVPKPKDAHQDVHGGPPEGGNGRGSPASAVAVASATATAKSKTTTTLVPLTGHVLIAELQATLSTETDRQVTRDVKAKLAFAYWAAKWAHPKTVFDDKRKRRLLQRLRERDDVSELLYAVDGAKRDPWEDRPRFAGIEQLFRDRETVERLAEFCPDYRTDKPHPMAVKYGLAAPAEARP